MKPRTRRIRIRGKTWRIKIGRLPKNNCDALCDYEQRVIWIRGKTTNEPHACVIHEVLHACHPDMEESAVEETEEALVAALSLIAA